MLLCSANSHNSLVMGLSALYDFYSTTLKHKHEGKRKLQSTHTVSFLLINDFVSLMIANVKAPPQNIRPTELGKKKVSLFLFLISHAAKSRVDFRWDTFLFLIK